MNAESDKIRATFADQLSSFDDRLDDKADEMEMLAEIQQGIGRLLQASGGSEAEIRRMLQERYDAGDLRKETFQLVKSMLDRFVSENVDTSPGTVSAAPASQAQAIDEPANDDPFGSTDVISSDAAPAPNAESRVQVGSVLRDRFLLQKRVSGGSMGVVYKALDRRLAEAGSKEPWVAIKVLSPQLARNGKALRALQQEAAKGRCLTHPNIVRFMDLDRDDDLYFIVMEWLEGRTLADILDSPDSKIVDREKAFNIVRQIGKALDYAHRCGIVHADVKPGNIMMMPNGSAKLFDFGVARVRQSQTDEELKFDPGVLGAMTPAYSSMQVLTGDEPVPADDVFSLACLLYRLIAGYRVFGPRNAAEAAEEGMKPQRLGGVTDTQWSAIRKALSYARVTRFDSMAGFLDALNDRSADTVNLDVGDHVEFEDGGGSLKWVFGLVTLLLLLGVAGYQFGLVDDVLQQFGDRQSGETVQVPSVPAEISTQPVVSPPANVENGDTRIEETVADTGDEVLVADASGAEVLVEDTLGAEVHVEDESSDTPVFDGPDSSAALPVVEIVDFSQLPLADIELPIAPGTFEIENVSVTLREDNRPVVVDLVRRGGIDQPLTLRLEEVGFSGNRSPWVSGQYEISDGGFVEFPAGQDRARVTLSMASDPLREADQQVTLRVREADAAAIELATIDVTLEDDDQRAFEAELPGNTVAFAASQVSVQERDPAVQIDLVRFNPDDTSLVVGYTVRDVTATSGEDYFPPGGYSVSFGPGQRSARLLIPLVQDSVYEGDEAFVVELATGDSLASMDVYYRVVIMIRDDDRG